MRMKIHFVISSIALISSKVAGLPTIEGDLGDNVYTYPAEDTIRHEATWLQWPHNYGWDPQHEERYETIWIEMTKALHTGEKVRIIVYDEDHRTRVDSQLTENGVDMSQIEFFVYPTDDVWTRDNGPVFVFDKDGNLIVEDWIFNGWVSLQLLSSLKGGF
jgi:agmatine deiminase